MRLKISASSVLRIASPADLADTPPQGYDGGMRKTDFEYQYIGSCSLCGTTFAPRSSHVLERAEEVSEVYAECGKCKASALVYVLKNDGNFVTTIGMLTDMKKDDILRFRKMQPITEDEVLRLHQILERKQF